MNDDINTLAWSWVDESKFAEIVGRDSKQRQHNKQCTPVSWIGERECEDASHDCA